MKLSEMIKTSITADARDFHNQDFEVDGKTVVKYTLDFIREGDDVVVDDNAKWYKANETVQINVPMPCITALKMDKAYASRRWLATDLTDEQKRAAGIIRGKGACMALSLELAKLKIKMYNKAKAAKLGLSKSTGNTGMVILENDLDTLLGKIADFDKDTTAYFTGATDDDTVVEDF